MNGSKRKAEVADGHVVHGKEFGQHQSVLSKGVLWSKTVVKDHSGFCGGKWSIGR